MGDFIPRLIAPQFVSTFVNLAHFPPSLLSVLDSSNSNEKLGKYGFQGNNPTIRTPSTKIG